MTMRSGVATAAVVAGALGAGLAWGVLAQRHELFPVSTARWVARAAGWIPPELPEAAEVSAKEFEPRLETLSALRSIPYVGSLPAERPEERGVVLFERERAWDGLNFWSSTQKSRAVLMDMTGAIVREWRYPLGGRGTWHHAKLLPDGGILVVAQDASLIRLDRDSRLVWAFPARAHHDLWVGDDRIAFLSREAVVFPEIHATMPVTDDRVVILTARGEKVEEFSLIRVLLDSPYRFLLSSVADREFPTDVTEIDLVHANHVEVFDGRLGEKSPLFARGNFLVSMKNVNAIAILEAGTRRVLWLWGPNNVVLQHHPRLLDDGTILLFDNGTERSRVLQVDPATYQVTWSYEDPDEFFSFWGGANQRLPNGNTLITETAVGEAFEVTPDGEVVWRFLNPDVDEKGKRWNIWRMTRVPRETWRN